jgi:hypothetical protein
MRSTAFPSSFVFLNKSAEQHQYLLSAESARLYGA